MPVYEYECPLHPGIVAIERSIHSPIPTSAYCETDDCRKVRVFRSPGVVFNTTGFYKTDNKRR